MINFISPPSFIISLAKKALGGNWSKRVTEVISYPSQDEICFYLQQAIDACYTSHGAELPKMLHDWEIKGIKIDFSTLPGNIQEGITGIIMQSPFGKSVIPKIVINIPQTSSIG